MTEQAFVHALMDVLNETFDTHAGIYLDKGTTLFETLDGASAIEASRATGTCATVAAHVAHVTFYLEVLERYMQTGDAGTVDWRDIWARVGAVTPGEWDRLRAELRAAASRVRAMIRERSEWNDDVGVGGALAILAHTAYHLGAIRSALCAGR